MPCQGGQPGAHSWENLAETTALCSETDSSSKTHDPMGVASQDVVLTWAQLSCLHQLKKGEGWFKKKKNLNSIYNIMTVVVNDYLLLSLKI